MLNMSPQMFIRIALEKPELAAQFMAARGAPPPPLQADGGLQTIPEMPGQPPLQTIPAMPQMQTIPAMPPALPPATFGAPGSDAGQVFAEPQSPTQINPVMNFAQSLLGSQAMPAMGDVPSIPEQPLPEGRKKGADNSEGAKRGQATAIPAQPVPGGSVPFDMRTNIPQWNGVGTPPPVAASQPVVTPAGQPQMAPIPAPTEIAALPVPPAAATAPVPAAASPGGPPTAPAAGPATPMDAFAQSLLGLATPSSAGGGGGRVAQAPAPYIQGALNPATAAILQQLLASAAQGPGQLRIGG